ncbi:hypothetical protein [Solibacillus sp. FSL K6-1523]|uniref:hypothetical protein n=1 Tax=Solibacillus sp. FSL K6-1523 TaxID=2921471 RepID=UPI0030FD1FC3
MAEAKKILASMGIDLDTKRFELKLRAIAKYTEALADELDGIDNAWTCEVCGHDVKVTCNYSHLPTRTQCDSCGALVTEEQLPTRIEGSD